MLNLIKRLVRDEEGQGMVEYGLIIALVSIVVLVALAAVGTNLTDIFNAIKDKLVVPAAGGTGAIIL